MIITVTKFKLQRLADYPRFFLATYQAFRQARKSTGIIKLRIDPIGLRTVTAWKTRQNMAEFRNSGAHLAAMKKSAQFGKIHSCTWETESLPTWKEAIRML